jgi:hypothetical protein
VPESKEELREGRWKGVEKGKRERQNMKVYVKSRGTNKVLYYYLKNEINSLKTTFT